jgi:enoyl-CoA hydratase/carnithine racemase
MSDKHYSYITVETVDRLTTITINRPDARNALNYAAHCELDAAFDAFAADDSQWVAIITGAGEKAFCAGQDLKEALSGDGIPFPKSGFGGLTAREGLNKPVIAAVNGVAMGGGFEIALACDLVVAHESAMFALPEVRVGLAAVAGGLHRLPREIGRQRAMSLLLTGRRVTAREGQALGFVTDVVDGNVLAAAKVLAHEILACSPMSIRATKEAVTRGLGVSLEQAMREQWNYPALQQMFRSEDAVEGPAAFAAKRAPEWKGR